MVYTKEELAKLPKEKQQQIIDEDTKLWATMGLKRDTLQVIESDIKIIGTPFCEDSRELNCSDIHTTH